MRKIAVHLKNRKALIAHIVVFISFLIAIFISLPFQFPEQRFNTLSILIIALGFYIHSFVLIPLLMNKKSKKYLLFTILAILIFSVVIQYLEAVRGVAITKLDGGIPATIGHFFMTPHWVFGSLMITLLIFIPLWFVSTGFSLILSGSEQIKKLLTSNQFELFVNLTIIVLLCTMVLLESHTSSLGVRFYILAFVMGVFYTNVFVVTPILIKERKVFKYIVSLVGLMVLYYILLALSNNTSNLHLIKYVSGLVNIGTFTFLMVILLVSFIYGYVRIKLKAREQLFIQKISNRETELEMLKSKVNPHFLFNSLNTLYATALEENAEKSAQSIAKLSNLIRYMQEDITKNFIELEKEVKYIIDYIAIQELRCSVTPEINTTFNCRGSHLISPGLFIPFVENAFKYGINPSKPSKLEVSIICAKDQITFSCENSFDPEYKAFHKEQGFGIGIKNAQQRLSLVYPEKHTFEIFQEEKSFSVYITIKTK